MGNVNKQNKDMKTALTDIVFDFDGTCTQIPKIESEFLIEYSKVFAETVVALENNEWNLAKKKVIDRSPQVGWMLGMCPSAPAAADPYILAYETASLILRDRDLSKEIPPSIHGMTSEKHQAPFRPEAREIFETLLKKNVRLHFISNSNSTKIKQRLCDLFAKSELPKGISVKSSAQKFRITELLWKSTSNNMSTEIQQRFFDLPVCFSNKVLSTINRPVYLRRGFYFSSIDEAFNHDWSYLPSTVFCGDIWEMDLAMPFALGANIHLIEREAPYLTYDYERQLIIEAGNKAKISANLSGLLSWL